MNVMYLCNNDYADIAGVSILSLLEHNKMLPEIHIYLVADHVSGENRKRLKQVVEEYGRELTIIDMPDIKSLAGCEIELHWWIPNVFSRVFLQEVLKEYPEVKRLIYMDCDTLIVGSLEELWQMELQGYIGAGVCEAMGDWHKKAIGLKSDSAYFNAGMFMVDVEKWKHEKMDAQAGAFIREKQGRLEYADESVLNGILAKRMLLVSPKYNLTSLSVYFTAEELVRYRKSSVNYTEQERCEALEDARVVHFTSTFLDVRPWMEGSKHPYAKEWCFYKGRSPWKDEPLRRDNRSGKKKAACRLMGILPRGLRLELAGFMHAYIKPLRYLR